MTQVYPDAIDLMGKTRSDDWKLDPRRDATQLPATAVDLGDHLRSSGIQEMMERYARADQHAIAAQERYKRLARLAAIASFSGVLLGTVALLALQFSVPRSILTVAALTQALLVIISISAALLNARWRPFQSWQEQRAEAENCRISLFDSIADIKINDTLGGRLQLALRLEYFRRYQLDVQHSYYGRRGAEHQANARRSNRWRFIALLLIIAGTASLLWSLRQQAWLPEIVLQVLNHIPERTQLGQTLFLALGIWASALQNLLSAFSLISLDERNASRYLTTASNLGDLKAEPLEEVRKAIEDQPIQNAAEMVKNFVALVHDQISSEHREWIALRKVAPEMTVAHLRQRRS